MTAVDSANTVRMTMAEVDKSDGLIFVVLSIDGFCRQQSRKIFQTRNTPTLPWTILSNRQAGARCPLRLYSPTEKWFHKKDDMLFSGFNKYLFYPCFIRMWYFLRESFGSILSSSTCLDHLGRRVAGMEW